MGIFKRQIVGEVVRERPSKSPHSKISLEVERTLHFNDFNYVKLKWKLVKSSFLVLKKFSKPFPVSSYRRVLL